MFIGVHESKELYWLIWNVAYERLYYVYICETCFNGYVRNEKANTWKSGRSISVGGFIKDMTLMRGFGQSHINW